MELLARCRTVLCNGELVRRSYRMRALSVADDATMDVSTWFQARVLMVSIALGHCSVCTGAPDVLDMS